ncbi:MAG: glycosyltransferase involved in cell wall biosynthesis [Bacteroidia bacterium]|jgi:glycosyltransferase involved in cell wall biosynthesis
MSAKPLVTVLFPVYNAQEFLQEAIDSVLNQSYLNLEILAINDGSTDSSPQMLAAIKDNRLQVIDNPQNLGLIKTLNRGIGLAKGKYIARADADDLCLSTRIENQVRFMESNTNIGISGTGFGTFGDRLELTETGVFSADHNEIRFRHLYQIHLMHGTSIWRTEIFSKHKIHFDPDYSHAEDYELFERIGQITQLSNIPDVLYHVRIREDSVSYQFDELQETNSIRIKKRAFSRLGLEMTEERLELFRDLCHHDHIKLAGSIIKVADLFTEMLNANSSSQYLPIDFLSQRLEQLWKGLLLNSPKSAAMNLASLESHEISKLLPITLSEKAKIRIKAFLN